MTRETPLFHKGHYNILAAQFREQLGTVMSSRPGQKAWGQKVTRTDAIVKLAISMAQRLELDNDNFDPVKWLNACSPDVDQWPLGELWDE